MVTNSAIGGEEVVFEFYKALKTHLESNMTLFTTVALNGLTTNTKSISIGSMPSPLGTKFYDDERQRVIQIQVLVKSTDPKEAMDTAEAINDFLDGSSFNVTGYKIESCESYVPPSLLEKTTASEWKYTAAYRVEIMKESE